MQNLIIILFSDPLIYFIRGRVTKITIFPNVVNFKKSLKAGSSFLKTNLKKQIQLRMANPSENSFLKFEWIENTFHSENGQKIGLFWTSKQKFYLIEICPIVLPSLPRLAKCMPMM